MLIDGGQVCYWSMVRETVGQWGGRGWASDLPVEAYTAGSSSSTRRRQKGEGVAAWKKASVHNMCCWCVLYAYMESLFVPELASVVIITLPSPPFQPPHTCAFKEQPPHQHKRHIVLLLLGLWVRMWV